MLQQAPAFRSYATASEGDVHFDVPLSNMAVEAFDSGDEGFVGGRLMPATPVSNESNKYYVIEKGAFLRNESAHRARGTRARTVEFEVSSESYFCDAYALSNRNALEDLANSDVAVQLRRNSTRLVVNNLVRGQEIRISNLVRSISNVGSGVALTGVNKWSDFNGSSPLSDVTTAHAFIQQNTGLIANSLVLDYDTAKILRRHPELLDMYKFTSGGMISNAQLMEAFDVSNLWVGRGIVENALEGATSSITNIWGNSAILARVGAATGLQTMTAGLRMQWRPEGFPAPFGVVTRRDVGAGTTWSEIVEAGHFQDEKIVAGDLIYTINDTL